MTNEEAIYILRNAAFLATNTSFHEIEDAVETAITALKAQTDGDVISRQAAIDTLEKWLYDGDDTRTIAETLYALPSAQPEIIFCRECQYGEQDNDGWWYCRSFGCQVGKEDGSGFCASAERKSGD